MYARICHIFLEYPTAGTPSLALGLRDEGDQRGVGDTKQTDETLIRAVKEVNSEERECVGTAHLDRWLGGRLQEGAAQPGACGGGGTARVEAGTAGAPSGRSRSGGR